MLSRTLPAFLALALLCAPSRATAQEDAQEDVQDDVQDDVREAAAPSTPEAQADVLSRALPALAAGGTTALVAIPASALGVAGGTAVCLYTLGFGGVVGLPFALAPVACGLCGGGVGTLVGIWTAGDDVCQPLWIGAGAGIGGLAGGLGLIGAAAGVLAAFQPIQEAFGGGGGMYSHVDELALYGGLIAGGVVAATLALGSVAVATLVALIPARPAAAMGTTLTDQRARRAAASPLDAPPPGGDVVIAY